MKIVMKMDFVDYVNANRGKNTTYNIKFSYRKIFQNYYIREDKIVVSNC